MCADDGQFRADGSTDEGNHIERCHRCGLLAAPALVGRDLGAHARQSDHPRARGRRGRRAGSV
jgi:hypothetical protein